jgi:hypothetical protein
MGLSDTEGKMNTKDGYRMLLSVEFGRTEIHRGTTPFRIDYRFAKLTPFGVIEAFGSVAYASFLLEGPMAVDTRMMNELGCVVNREEMSRIVETSANCEFGVGRFNAA